MGENRTLKTQGRTGAAGTPRQPEAAFRAAARKPMPFPELKNIPSRGPTEKEKNELTYTNKEIDSLDRKDVYSLATVMKSCFKWKMFFNISSEPEALDTLPYFRKFIRAMKSYISDAPTERALLAMQDLTEFMKMDVPPISYALVNVCSDDPRREVRLQAFNLLESNFHFLISATDFYAPEGHTMLEQFSLLLETYADLSFITEESFINEILTGNKPLPPPFNEAATISICSFLFCNKEALLHSTEGTTLLPYAIAWSINAPNSEDAKIDFMSDELSQLPRDSRMDILLKVAVFANSDSLRECALDLLVNMGVYKVKNKDENGAFVDNRWVNALLQLTFDRRYGRFANKIVMPETHFIH